MTPEVALRRRICAWLRFHGALVWVHDSVGIWDPTKKTFRRNVDPYRRKGVSDILGIWKGKFVAIEVKIKGRYATKEQEEFIEDVNKSGGIGLIAYSLEMVQERLWGEA